MGVFGYNIFNSYSKFLELIASRNNSNKKVIDKKIWKLFGNKFAVVFTDFTGFTLESEEQGIIESIKDVYERFLILAHIIEDFSGIIIKTEADCMVILFQNAQDAVDCSIEMQKEGKKNDIGLHIGIGYGDILKIGDYDIFGEEVNTAANLCSEVSESAEIIISKNVAKNIKDVELIEKDIHFSVNY